MAQLVGGVVVVLGPDGSGKTTVLREVAERSRPHFENVELRHWRPNLLLPSRGLGNDAGDPHGAPPRSWAVSVLKLGFLLTDWWLAYALLFGRRRSKKTLYLFDRHFLDLLVDPARYRYGGPAGLVRLAVRSIPTPDLVFVLDAPASVLQSRKREVPDSESERQRQGYRTLAERLPNAVLLNASRPVEEVASEILTHIADRTARRAA